jgi:MOSC domain-containing protein YiiM
MTLARGLTYRLCRESDVAGEGHVSEWGMLDVELSPATAGPRLLGSFRACLSSVLEIPLGEVPQPEDLRAAVAQWRTWLAGRGVGLVPIADASRFQWPGYWVAVLDATPESKEQTAVLMFGSPSGVVLSPQSSALLGRAAADLPVAEGYVVAAFDPVWSSDSRKPVQRGRVEAVAIADRAGATMQQVTTARAIPGRGLEGDRYANRVGTFTPRGGGGVGYDLTLIEAEVLDELTLTDGHRLGYTEARRNIVTRGIDLNTLVGQRFRVGDVECVGRRLCEPCAHLERLTHRGVLRKLIHRGGLRADILTTGSITEGAAIECLERDEVNPPR